MNFFNKVKYKAIMVIKEQETYRYITTKNINVEKAKDFKYKDKKYSDLDISKPCYIKGLTIYYFIEINKGQIFFHEKDLKDIDYELIDLFTSKRIFANILSSFNITNFGKRIFDIIFGASIGIAIGIGIGVFLP